MTYRLILPKRGSGLLPALALITSSLPAFGSTGHNTDIPLHPNVSSLNDEVEVFLSTRWESHYFSEGRNNLDGDSIWASTAEAGWNHLSGGVWYAHSPEQDYRELHLFLALTESFGDFEVYLGYTHLRLLSDDLHDNEIGTGFSWTGLPFELELTADAYYSFDAEGSFWELGLHRQLELTDKLVVTGSSTFGNNQGYISDGHDGANNIALVVSLDYALTENCALTAHYCYSFALNEDSTLAGDDLLRDLPHGGVGIEYSF